MAYNSNKNNSNNKNNNKNNSNNKNNGNQNKEFGQPVQLGVTGLAVTDMRIYPVQNGGKLLATATITINGCLVLKKIKIIDGNKGPFMAMYSESYDKQGEKTFVDIYFFMDNEARTKLEELIVTEYETM